MKTDKTSTNVRQKKSDTPTEVQGKADQNKQRVVRTPPATLRRPLAKAQGVE